MKPYIKIFLAVLLLPLGCQLFAMTPRQQEILRAMKDEMARSAAHLKSGNLAKPYFITYTLADALRQNFAANQGALVEESESNFINIKVSLRAGSPADDNGFFESYIFSSSSSEQPPSAGYDGIRAALWQETNKAYTGALAQLAKKQAYKKNKNITESFPDFSPAAPAVHTEEFKPVQIDAALWRGLTKEMSKQGNMKEIDSFTVNTAVMLYPSYFITSEGAEYVYEKNIISITINASAKTKNGFELKETKSFVYADFKDVPQQEELLRSALDFALQVSALTKAEKAEPFIGPVMLEGPAAAALFNNIFAYEAGRTKPVLSETRDPVQGEFSRKQGLKIMPVDFDVVDDPQARSFNNQTLMGYRLIDDEGAAAQKITLVKNGKLVDLPTTRSLIKGQKASNGHASVRGSNLFAQAEVTNLFFNSHDPLPKAEFKTKFMQYCRQEGLDYCYIIKGSPFGAAISAYKMDAKTGRETPVYGATITDLGTRTLRDIRYAADDMTVYNTSAASVITPSLILKEAEIKPAQRMPVRAPLVPRP